SAMQDTLGQTDLNSKAVAALTKLYFGIPGDRNTVLTSDDKQALAAIGITQSAIDGLPSQKDIAVQVASDAAVAAASRVAGGLAGAGRDQRGLAAAGVRPVGDDAGGGVRDGRGGVGDATRRRPARWHGGERHRAGRDDPPGPGGGRHPHAGAALRGPQPVGG